MLGTARGKSRDQKKKEGFKKMEERGRAKKGRKRKLAGAHWG